MTTVVILIILLLWSVSGRSRIIYDGDELMKAAQVLAVKSNLFRNRVGSNGVLTPPAEKILDNGLTVEEPAPVVVEAEAPAVPVDANNSVTVFAGSVRPGLELALKIVRNLPPMITAEQALLIAMQIH